MTEMKIIETGDLVVAESSIRSGVFSPVEVLDVDKDQNNPGIRLGADVWQPVRNYILAKEGIERLIIANSHKTENAKKSLEYLGKEKIRLENLEKDMANESVPNECIIHGHKMVEIYRGVEEEKPKKGPYRIMKCTHCSNRVREYL